MRTTITLPPDLHATLRRLARERNQTLSQVISDLLRDRAEGASGSEPFRQTTYSMGPARVDLTKALALAAQLEDEEIARKLELRK
jgi:predicted transcriptional regulator